MTVMAATENFPSRAISVDDVIRMGKVGVFGEYEHVELLDGRLIPMPPQSEEHASAIERFAEALRAVIGQRAIIRVHSPVSLDRFAQLEPDVVVPRVDREGRGIRVPGPDDVVVAIEISPTSLAVDLVHQRVEVSDTPRPDGYRRTVVLASGADLRLQEYDASVAVSTFLA